jgi:hypothetical protein
MRPQGQIPRSRVPRELPDAGKGVDSTEMGKIKRLEKVSIFGGKLSFLVPHEWVETVEEDHYLYHEPDTESGWLRVSLITVRVSEEVPAQRLKRHFDSTDNVTVERQTRNLVSFSEKDSEDEGVSIHLYYWKVANVVLPDMLCEAVFSYTVRLDRVNAENTRAAAKLIGELVSRADFFQPA